jgi:TM2 domain-containing membrane protein YozV
MTESGSDAAEKKILAGILGILLGSLGVHKFVLGYSKEGTIMLGLTLASWVLTFCTFGLTFFLPLAVSVIGLVEGIIYLTKSDEEFAATYLEGRKPWF